LLNDSLTEGRYEETLAHADALLRTRPRLWKEIAPVLSWLVGNDSTRDEVIGVLADDPPWRGWLLGELSRQHAARPVVLFDVYLKLKESEYPPSDAELQPFLGQLVEADAFELAYLAWLKFLPEGAGSQVPFVYNGDFERPVSGLPFDWVTSKVRGATTDVLEAPTTDSHALRVEFANTRVAYSHTAKLLLLPPGLYTLRGEWMADRLENERGLVWRLTCAEADGQVLGATKGLVGTVPWQAFELTFEVPPSGCRGQWLRLQLAARTAIEQQISGEAWFDNISIERSWTN